MTERRARYSIGVQEIWFNLGFPDPSLSPNAKKRAWYYREEARSSAREAAFSAAKVSMRECGLDFCAWEKLPLYAEITFNPPNKRHRDLDNLLASMKPDIDGLCSALGVDDSQIKKITLQWGGVVEYGDVDLRLSLLDTQGENAKT